MLFVIVAIYSKVYRDIPNIIGGSYISRFTNIGQAPYKIYRSFYNSIKRIIFKLIRLLKEASYAPEIVTICALTRAFKLTHAVFGYCYKNLQMNKFNNKNLRLCQVNRKTDCLRLLPTDRVYVI